MDNINKEDLIEYGFENVDLPAFPYVKYLSEPNGEKEEPLKLVVTNLRNVPEFALMLPSGNTLFLRVKSLEQLKVFEESIESWEPYY